MMNTTWLKVIVLTILLFLLIMIPFSPVIAQDCDPDAIFEWLVQRQAWLNASNDVIEADNLSLGEAQLQLFDHMQAIEDLPRPQCADSALAITYYAYNQYQHVIVCMQIEDDACVSEMGTRLDWYRTHDDAILDPLYQLSGFLPADFTDLRPDGWYLN